MADTNNNDGFDFSEFYGAEPGSVTYDSNGNYTGSVPESEVSEPDNTDFSNWSEVNTDENGNITGWNDDFGNVEYSDGEVKYRDSKGDWQTFNNANKSAVEQKSNQVQHILGAAATPQAIANLQNANPMDLSTALEYAETGKNNGGLASVILLSGTVPDIDSLKGLGYKEGDIATAINFSAEVANNMKNGQSMSKAWANASKSLGDPYGTAGRNTLLKNAVINTVSLYGGPLISGLAKLGVSGHIARTLAHTNGATLQMLREGGPAAQQVLSDIIRVSTQAGNKVEKGAIIADLVAVGINNAKELVDQVFGNDKKSEGNSDLEDTRATEDKTPETASSPAKSEPTAARPEPKSESKSEPKSEPKTDTSNTGTLTFPNPFGGDTTISVPKGPLEGTPLAGTGLPGHEPVETTKEGYETEDDSDSGSDTLEESSPDTGVGTGTYANPNDDTDNNGVGLGEEDPNKANYDNDKWNRGMEYVSTDVVSDKRIKDFITKTYKNDPILIRTVKILKTRK